MMEKRTKGSMGDLEVTMTLLRLVDELRFRAAGALYRIARPLNRWCLDTIEAERIQHALKRGDRVRLTGKCCSIGAANPGALCTIMEYDDDAGDYRVILDGKQYKWMDGTPMPYEHGGYDYACERGFEVVSRASN